MIVPALLIATAGILLALGLWVLAARPRRPINLWFTAYTFAMAGWAFAIGILHTGVLTETAVRASFVSAGFIPACFLGFATVYPTVSRWPSRPILVSVLAAAAAFAVLAATTTLLVHDPVVTPVGFTRKSGGLYPVFAVYFLGVWLTAFVVFASKWRSARGQARAQLQYLGLGLLLSFAGGVTTNLLMPFVLGRATQTWLGPFFTLPMVALVGHAIIHYRLMDLRLIVRRGVALAVVVTAVSAGVLLVLDLLQPQALNSLGAFGLVGLVSMVLAVVVAAGVVVPRITRLVDRYFLRAHVDYDHVLVEATHRLRGVMQPAELATEIERILKETLAPECVVVLAASSNSDRWVRLLITQRGDLDDSVLDQAWRLSGPMPGVSLVQASVDERRDRGEVDSAIALINAAFEVWIALGRGQRRLGVILIGPRRNGDAYLARDLDFLKALAEVATTAFELIELHERHLALERERERDAHLARMAELYAGLAHEMRTPLTTLSNLINGLPDHLDDPEFRELLMRLVPSEITRIVALADKLGELVPASLPEERVPLHSLLEDVVALCRAKPRERVIDLQLEVESGLPTVTGHSYRLIQLFTNLLQNALDASPAGTQVRVRASFNDSSVAVAIIDEGSGIDPKVCDRLFEPFVTTKPSGMGLGLSICREIARAHDARLTVESLKDRPGAKAEVVFPIHHRQPPHIWPVQG